MTMGLAMLGKVPEGWWSMIQGLALLGMVGSFRKGEGSLLDPVAHPGHVPGVHTH